MKPQNNLHAFIWDLGGVILRAGDPTPNEPLAIRLSGDCCAANPQPNLCIEAALVNFIRVLRSSYPTALLIQSREDLRLALNNLWQFEDAFDEIFVSVDQDVWAQEMPDLSRALLQLHVKAGQATLIDDDPRHVRAAKAAGMQAIRYHDPAQIGSAVFDVLVEQAA